MTPQSYRFVRAREFAYPTNGQARQLERIAFATLSPRLTLSSGCRAPRVATLLEQDAADHEARSARS